MTDEKHVLDFWNENFTRHDRFILFSAFEIARISGKWNTYTERNKLIANGIFPILGLWGQSDLLDKIIYLDRENYNFFYQHFFEMLPKDTLKSIQKAIGTMPFMKEYFKTLTALNIGVDQQGSKFTDLSSAEEDSIMERAQKLVEYLHLLLDVLMMKMIFQEQCSIDRENDFATRFLTSSRLASMVNAQGSDLFQAFNFDIDAKKEFEQLLTPVVEDVEKPSKKKLKILE